MVVFIQARPGQLTQAITHSRVLKTAELPSLVCWRLSSCFDRLSDETGRGASIGGGEVPPAVGLRQHYCTNREIPSSPERPTHGAGRGRRHVDRVFGG